MPLVKIKAAQITEVKCLGLADGAKRDNYGQSRPVFKVTFKTGEPIVVKAELATDGKRDKTKSAVFGALIMEAVDSKLKFELLTPDEITELGKVKAACFLPDDRQELAKQYLTGVMGAPIFFMTKMAFVPQLRSLETQLTKVDAKVVERAQKLVTRMSTTAALNQLGKIIAADLFNGNHDRFDAQGNLVNLGNVMFEKMGDKSYVPVGLDHLDPNSDFANLAKRIELKDWGGANLKKAGEVAVRVLQSINAKIRELVPQGAPQLDQTKCGGILKGGIEEGADMIKKHLLQMYSNGSAVPAGARQRMEALSWMK